MRIINLTQHVGTPEQGVIEVKQPIQKLLNFDSLPSKEEILLRAKKLTEIAKELDGDAAMVGGAIFLMPQLCIELRKEGIIPLAAFSQRISKEEKLPDGSVRKINIFKHLGFVEIP